MAQQLVKVDLVGNFDVRGKGFLGSTAVGELVVHEQLTALAEGISWKDNVRVATQSNTNLSSPGATVDGITMVANDRVLVKAQTSQPENGIYIWNGSAVAMTRALDASTFDEIESAIVPVDEGTNAGTSWRQTQVNGVIGTNNVIWTAFGSTAPNASETVAGLIEIATQAEVNAGASATLAVTPNYLANWTGAAFRYAVAFGNGSATQYDITHNLGSSDVLVEVRETGGNQETVICQVRRTTANVVRLNFNTAPTSNQYTAIIKY